MSIIYLGFIGINFPFLVIIMCLGNYIFPKNFILDRDNNTLQYQQTKLIRKHVDLASFTHVIVSRRNLPKGIAKWYCEIKTGTPYIIVYDGIDGDYAKQLGEVLSEFLEVDLQLNVKRYSKRSKLFIVTEWCFILLFPIMSLVIAYPSVGLLFISLMLLDLFIAIISLLWSMMLYK